MKILLTSLLTTLVLTTNGQHVPYGLRETKVKRELLTRSTGFDSLILVDKASYWDEDMKISGLGFKNNLIYKLTVNYRADTTSFYDIAIEHFGQEEMKENQITKNIRKINFQSISNLNNDSLNLKPSWSISDQDEWTILTVIKGQIVIKQCYAPDSYQGVLPTEDRQMFINLFNQLSKWIN
jgi:hypothetical protein